MKKILRKSGKNGIVFSDEGYLSFKSRIRAGVFCTPISSQITSCNHLPSSNSLLIKGNSDHCKSGCWACVGSTCGCGVERGAENGGVDTEAGRGDGAVDVGGDAIGEEMEYVEEANTDGFSSISVRGLNTRTNTIQMGQGKE